ncbi:hypothetical protein GCM10010156_66190 [Planobispora rosea]|uniref:Antitoxin n=1 Tax=Planobispora rosea TaxID=35762 RepID=A0A8J3S667_PLARO|nr:type II toxin-antitoxin system Phd/YefM family antitoxin [Planobispora rosea]GGS98828.1 hypothetical protein GCM10010156_66190 [Planobispora rosea]GIH87983.1 hypothetical protein Pro02_63910 [Planobispora rosea]
MEDSPQNLVDAAQADFPRLITGLAADGLQAPPVFIGDQRGPQAVMLSVPLYQALMQAVDAERLEDLLSAPTLRERLAATEAAGGATYTTLEDLAVDAGVDPAILEDPPGR